MHSLTQDKEPRRRAVGCLALAATMLALAWAAPAADGKVVWRASGGGFGHGVGLSQYGAYGYAKRGTPYHTILAHYYTGTTIGSAPTQTVRVLLSTGLSSAYFYGAESACGRNLNPAAGFGARRKGSSVVLINRKGRKIADCGAMLATTGSGPVRLVGKGTYRGSLEIRNEGSLTAVNAVGLEDYVRGVVAAESPSNWPPDALKAQAVAARSYAIASKLGGGFDHYDDTRSQVYGGVGAEKASSNAAIAATAGEVVLYNGRPAQTFFFSTSGGHTENNENSFLGGTPQPYLRGVPDPYDTESPYHTWTVKYSPQALGGKLGVGTLKTIVVLNRGVSGRIVKLKATGTGGASVISGPSMKSRLGLRDTLVYFTKVRSGKGRAARRASRASKDRTEVPIDSRTVFGTMLPA